MMFNKDASSNVLRQSLRSRVSAFGTALKPKRNSHYPSAILPSTPQSECSTLVDFVIEDVFVKGDDKPDFETDEYMLDADNSAWANGRFTTPSNSKKQRHSRATKHASVPLTETQVLGRENTAWMAGHTGAPKSITKSRIQLFSQSACPSSGTSGIEPEYLDPEDRAWV